MQLGFEIDTSAWDASKQEIVPFLQNPELLGRLAHYFSRLAALARLNDLYIDRVVGMGSVINSPNSGQVRAAMRDALIRQTEQLIKEVPHLDQGIGAAGT